MHRLIKTFIALVVFCLLQSVGTTVAYAKAVDKNQAVKAVKRQYSGKIIKVSNSSDHYKVRLLQKDGRVVNVKVDKASGKVSSSGKKARGRGRGR